MATKVCTDAWECEPRLILNKEYEVVKEFFYNGEDYLTLRDEHGEFDSPGCFFYER